MDLLILKKKIDGYRLANRCIKKLPPELLLELRQTWENFSGDQDEFRSKLGLRIGTLRNLLVESKKLNHAISSSTAIGLPHNGLPLVELGNLQGQEDLSESGMGATPKTSPANHGLELVFDDGNKIIRFPNVDLLIEFLRKVA